MQEPHFGQLVGRPSLNCNSHSCSHPLQRNSTLHSPLFTYSPPEISIALPLTRASITFSRAFCKSFQKVLRETPIISAASFCSTWRRSQRRICLLYTSPSPRDR